MNSQWLLRQADQSIGSIEDLLQRRRDSDPLFDAGLGQLPQLSLLDQEVAAACLLEHLTNGKIGVCGDYDVDGVCGTTLAVQVLRALGGEVVYTIPDRFEDGYGINARIVRTLVEQGATCILTVDNGIKAFEAAEQAKQLGVAYIVTDHHLPDDTLPAATAIVNPNRIEETSELGQDICGTAVLFYVLASLRKLAGDANPVKLSDYLDLVAVATVADVMPLVGINRILVKAGLSRLMAGKNLGLAQLARNNSRNGVVAALTARDIGFGIGPRINAAGRVQSALLAAELLMCNEPSRVEALANQIEGLNTERKNLEALIVDEVASMEGVVVEARPHWHRGVVGIAASRIARSQNAPCILGQLQEDGTAVCSARSVPGFDMYPVLAQFQDQLKTFGGHSAAAGFSGSITVMAAMQRALQAAFGEAYPNGYVQQISIDALVQETPPASQWESLTALEPTGQANPEYCVGWLDASVQSQRLVNGRHMFLTLRGRSGERVDAVYWNWTGESRLPQTVHVAGHLEWDTFRGRHQRRLRLVDIVVGRDPLLPTSA